MGEEKEREKGEGGGGRKKEIETEGRSGRKWWRQRETREKER